MCPCECLSAFATAPAISEDHQALAGRLMLPKAMAEAAASLRSLVKVWVGSERESVVKLEGDMQWALIKERHSSQRSLL